MQVLFNRSPLATAGSIEQPTNDEVKDTPSLWNASLEDAVKYGGDLTRAALSAMSLVGDKRYVIVDTKVHMLAPGQFPALPGWHTDGTPRLASHVGVENWHAASAELETDEERRRVYGATLHPQNKGLPVIAAQEVLDSPRFHLLVTGTGCLTQFLDEPVWIDVPDEPSRELYKQVTRRVRELVESGERKGFDMPSCTAVEWDWWALHQAQAAQEVEWRFLIRVTESDHNEPQTDLRKVIRTQNQVFVPGLDAGW
jgi:hypothetical protein